MGRTLKIIGATVVIYVLTAFAPGSSMAVTLVTPDGQVAQPYQRWANASKVPTPPGPAITVHDGSCPYYGDGRSCAYPTEIWLTPGAGRFVFMHELGHIFDWREAPLESVRARLRVLLDATVGGWFDPDLPHGDQAGERFASAYSECADGIPTWLPSGLRWQVTLLEGWHPTTRRLRAICAVIRHEGGWYMRPAG